MKYMTDYASIIMPALSLLAIVFAGGGWVSRIVNEIRELRTDLREFQHRIETLETKIGTMKINP